MAWAPSIVVSDVRLAIVMPVLGDVGAVGVRRLFVMHELTTEVSAAFQ